MFTFPVADQGKTEALEEGWRIRLAPPGAGEAEGYASASFDDSDWERVRLPHLGEATIGRDTLWFRRRITLPSLPPGERVLLKIEGALYYTKVWLDGKELGRHEGYFDPFGFDLTEASPGEHVLAIACRFPVEAGSFKHKTCVAGVLADWDCKPYPSAFFPNLPPPYEWTVPVGLWRPVHLQRVGPLFVESYTLFPSLTNPRWPAHPFAPGADTASVRVQFTVRNLTQEWQTALARVDLAAYRFTAPGASGALPISLAPNETRDFQFTLGVPEPRLWFPWTHGEPCLYEASLRIEGTQQKAENSRPKSPDHPITASPDRGIAASDTIHRSLTTLVGLREMRAIISEQGWEWRLNGRRIFPRGSNYIADFSFDRITEARVERDLELARGANLDMLRVHAHLAPDEVYRLCDELGLMVMCDFPLIWTYAYGLPPEAEQDFRESVRRQAAQMVALRATHPSIVLWSMHNEPPWTPEGDFLGRDVHEAAINHEIDQELAQRVRDLDPTRPAVAASGEKDQHLYHGWYTGHWRDNRELQPTFPTEFGVQALPSLDSPFWATVNTNWPVESDDPSWAYAGFQSVFWTSPGVGAPAQFNSLADYIREGQSYQAFYLRYTIDQWRRKKFAPVGGYIQFMLTDAWPAITWSVLDYYRLPKAGYAALADASRPAHVCLDLQEGFTVEGGYQLVYPEGGAVRVGLSLVNDDYRLGGRVQIRWWIAPRVQPRGLGFLRWLTAHSFLATLPRADEPASELRSISVPLKEPGEYVLRVRMTQGSVPLDENRLYLRVGPPRPISRTARRVPGFLISHVYEAGSLMHSLDGVTLQMRNPAMPVTLQSLDEVRIDGQVISNAQVELLVGGLARRASTVTPQAPMEVPSNERFTVIIHGERLVPGMHELEVTARFFGFGEITARWKDKLA